MFDASPIYINLWRLLPLLLLPTSILSAMTISQINPIGEIVAVQGANNRPTLIIYQDTFGSDIRAATVSDTFSTGHRIKEETIVPGPDALFGTPLAAVQFNQDVDQLGNVCILVSHGTRHGSGLTDTNFRSACSTSTGTITSMKLSGASQLDGSEDLRVRNVSRIRSHSLLLGSLVYCTHYVRTTLSELRM